MTQSNEKGNIYFEDKPIYILLDIAQTTQARSLLFIVKDLKSTHALDEQELSLFQLESLCLQRAVILCFFPTLG